MTTENATYSVAYSKDSCAHQIFHPMAKSVILSSNSRKVSRNPGIRDSGIVISECKRTLGTPALHVGLRCPCAACCSNV